MNINKNKERIFNMAKGLKMKNSTIFQCKPYAKTRRFSFAEVFFKLSVDYHTMSRYATSLLFAAFYWQYAAQFSLRRELSPGSVLLD